MNIANLEKELVYMIYFKGSLPENFTRKILFDGKILLVVCTNGSIIFCQNLKTKKVYYDLSRGGVAI